MSKNYCVREEFIGKTISLGAGLVSEIKADMPQKEIKRLILHSEDNQRFFYPVEVPDEVEAPKEAKK
jgi:hypothetical protein